MSLRIGAHFDLTDVIAQAQAARADCIQIFLSDPQTFKIGELAYPGGASALEADAREAGIDIYVHSPYLVNVASLNNRVRIPSRKLLGATIAGAQTVGAKGVVVHGGNVGADGDPITGFVNWRKAIDELDLTVPLLIENTAGGVGALARTLERIEQLWLAVESSANAARVGFALDTCHAWAAGLDLATVVDDIRQITGRIDLVHANDSRDAAGSGADRHTNFGAGMIPDQFIVDVVRAAGAPVICETKRDVGADIAWLRARL